MVCTGNICRSPTAEGVLRAKLTAAGLGERVQVGSAGITGYHSGEAPDPRAQRHAAKRGYDLSALRARRIAPEDYEHFDLILALDGEHLAHLQAHAPAASRARVQPLLRYARRLAGAADVPDPYYGSADGFERVLDLVEDACDGLVESLAAELGSTGAVD
ncbi:MAG: low molecular weight phosphotyrosine protein phosphatase [Burkholderiales bacterium]|nr:low molecular weight phosphotyrosine protein phosphatase [Burkholderiales bacterium]